MATSQIVYAIEVNYGYGDGWEWETTEETREDAVAQLRCYRENCGYPVRMRRRRMVGSETQSTTREGDYA